MPSQLVAAVMQPVEHQLAVQAQVVLLGAGHLQLLLVLLAQRLVILVTETLLQQVAAQVVVVLELVTMAVQAQQIIGEYQEALVVLQLLF
jgi:hypothetical protein